MTQHIAGLHEAGAAERPPLAAAMAAAGRHAWTHEAIEAHMSAEAAKLPGNAWWHIEQGLTRILGSQVALISSRVRFKMFIAGLVMVLLGLLGTLFSGAALAFGAEHLLLTRAFGLSLTSLVAGGLVAGAIWKIEHIEVLHPARWVDYAWHPNSPHLRGTIIPAAAIKMAQRLAEYRPDLKFVIAKLERPHHTGLFDPVLFALAEGEDGPETKHPMCAWNPDGSLIEPPPPRAD